MVLLSSSGRSRVSLRWLAVSAFATSLAWGSVAMADDVSAEGEVVVPSSQVEYQEPPPSEPAPAAAPAQTMSDYGPPIDMRYVDAEDDAFAKERAPNKAVGVAESFGSLIFNTFFFPIKAVVGVGGAALGGTIGALSGGDERAAAQIWNVTTDGDYFVTPSKLEGRTEFRFTGDHP